MSYSQKLKSPKWQRKRLEILQRDDFTCQMCSDTENQLQIHHKNYTGEPYEAPLEDLVTLCLHCHEAETIMNRQNETIVFVYKENTNFFGKLKSGKLVLGVINDSKTSFIVVNKVQKLKSIIESIF